MYKILLVEDDAGIAKEIADYAAGWGLEVHIVKNFEKVNGGVCSGAAAPCAARYISAVL